MPRATTPFLAVLVAVWAMTGTAQAAGSSGALPPPDPTAANLTPAQIQQRALNACLVTQARLMNVAQEEVRAPCSCYAQRTVRAMSRDEIASFRATGYFDDTTRAKALGFIDTCKLRRPI